MTKSNSWVVISHAGPAAPDTGIVDQDVGRAKLAGYCLEQACHALFISHIGLPDDGSSPCGLHPAPALFGAGLVRVEGDRNVRARLRELLGDCLAHSGIRAGNEGNLVVELQH
jgi:hypothetical protein